MTVDKVIHKTKMCIICRTNFEIIFKLKNAFELTHEIMYDKDLK